MHISTKQIMLSWVWLIMLTLLSITLGVYLEHNRLFIGAALVIACLKGQQIIDIFMELKYAPPRWRKLLLSYIIIVPALLLFIYFL
jgi:cytochrome c oxidase subunit IV